MLFSYETYSDIKLAMEKKQEISFFVSKSESVFAESDAPADWVAFPPTMLAPAEYLQILIQVGASIRDALMRLEINVHLSGGRIFYKKHNDKLVALKMTWPVSDV